MSIIPKFGKNIASLLYRKVPPHKAKFCTDRGGGEGHTPNAIWFGS